MEVEQNCGSLKTNKCCCYNHIDECEKYSKESDEISPDLEDKLHRIAREEGFTKYKIHAKHISPDGNNYMGILYEVTIKGTMKVGDRVLELFVKVILSNKENIKMCEIDHLYDSEIYVYKELAHILNELQEAAKIPLKDRFNFVKCYKESDNKFIIMENMAKKGFGTCSRIEVVSLKFAEKAIDNLAKFHAMSFVLQGKRPKYFNEKIKTVEFPIYFNEEWSEYIKNMYSYSSNNLDENSRQLFKKLTVDVVTKKLNKYYKPGPNKAVCLCHGDYKTGNILTRQVGDEIELVPIDYQIMHFGLPTTDLIYLLFTSTDKEFRKKHLEYLKNFYYDAMEKFMKYFDLHIEDFFPKKEYEKLFTETLDFGLLVASWMLPFHLSREDDLVDLEKTTIKEIKFAKNEIFRVRLQEIVDEFIEWGYL